MSDIYERAWKGTLDEASILSNLSIINKRGGKRSITLLGAACRNGHIDVVRLLLKHKADPDALSSNDRTPLFYVTRYAPVADRLDIVTALLDAHADPDKASVLDRRYTPLMNAITQIRDKDVIHLLVDRGARLDLQNSARETAGMLAKRLKMEPDLLPQHERKANREGLFSALMSVVTNIIGYANSGIQQQVNGVVQKVKGAAEAVYGVKAVPDQKFANDIGQAASPEEFAAGVGKYMEESGLDGFLPPDDQFFKELARKAALLRADTTTDLGKPENIKRLTCLALYQPIIYCDDSESMEIDDRWDQQRELAAHIARIATKLVPYNLPIELRFMNAESSSKHTADDILKAMDNVEPDGLTPIGTGLREKILQPLIYDVLSKGPLLHPFIVCIMTDGKPEDEPKSAFVDAIVECRKKLMSRNYSPRSVIFNINQIGNDKKATEFLDGLKGNPRIEDVVYCTTGRMEGKYRELRKNTRELEVWLLKLLASPIMNRDI